MQATPLAVSRSRLSALLRVAIAGFTPRWLVVGWRRPVAVVTAGRMGRVSTSSPTRDAQRRRPGGTVLAAVLERITYTNEETGYTIARVATDRSGADLLTVVGALLGV